MPEATVFGARVSIENAAHILRGQFVFLLLRFFVKDQQQISRHHVIQRVDWPIDSALIVNVLIDPGLNVIEVTLVPGPQIYQVLAVEIERLGIAPTFERFAGWISLYG